MDRRNFIRHSVCTGFALSTASFPLHAMFSDPEIVKLTILHTNDVHSRIEPFPMDGSKNEGKGGTAKRATLIKKIRAQEKNVLLFDAGDIFQGTPYFNYFGGELEIKLMSEMGYDAATMGNHDFDGGLFGFDKQLPFANFPFVSSNYNFDDTMLQGKIHKYKIFKKEGLKIGVFGLGIELNGLVPQSLFQETKYEDALRAAEFWSTYLKQEEKCDYVICLSHLGYKYVENKVSDQVIATNTSDIDLIIGGHTHTFMDAPEKVKNKLGRAVLIHQVGWAGMVLGRLDVLFERNKKGHCVTCKNILI